MHRRVYGPRVLSLPFGVSPLGLWPRGYFPSGNPSRYSIKFRIRRLRESLADSLHNPSLAKPSASILPTSAKAYSVEVRYLRFVASTEGAPILRECVSLRIAALCHVRLAR